jgi:hypothetical protein
MIPSLLLVALAAWAFLAALLVIGACIAAGAIHRDEDDCR